MCRIYTLLTVSVIFLFGCATTPKANLGQFKEAKAPIYPPIAIVTTSEELQYRHSRSAFIGALQETGAFESILIDSPFAEFAMEVNLNTINELNGNTAEGLAKGVIFGSTLGLVPVNVKFVTQSNIKLRYRGIIFDQFDIKSEYSSNISILSIGDKDAGLNGSYRKAVELILLEMQKRESIPLFLESLKITSEKNEVHL